MRNAIFDDGQCAPVVPSDFEVRSVGITYIRKNADTSEEGLLVTARGSRKLLASERSTRMNGIAIRIQEIPREGELSGGTPTRCPCWVSHEFGKPGTAGAIVTDANGGLYIVSAAHVIAGMKGQAVVGDPVHWAPPVTHVNGAFAPSGKPQQIGKFVNGYFPKQGAVNYEDLAVARLDPEQGEVFRNTPGIKNIGRLSSYGAAPRPMERVCYTPADGRRIQTKVRTVDTIAKLDFWGTEYRFDKLTILDNRAHQSRLRLSQQGHSGSLVVNGNRQPIGLVFYADAANVYTCSLAPIFTDLGLLPFVENFASSTIV